MGAIHVRLDLENERPPAAVVRSWPPLDDGPGAGRRGELDQGIEDMSDTEVGQRRSDEERCRLPSEEGWHVDVGVHGVQQAALLHRLVPSRPFLDRSPGDLDVFLGRDLMTRSDVSDSISRRIDEQIRSIVDLCYRDTQALVASHRDCMDRLVEMLIEKETLDGDEFRAVVAEFTTIPEKDRFSPLLPAA